MKFLVTPRSRAKFQRRLLGWYRSHRRALPWRASRDPYRIWIAEIMLQQTRIAAVLPYYRRFLKRFPTVVSLARAREERVLQTWSGLGYYARARNLRRAAQEVVSYHDGRFPRTIETALGLPGVGRYTAAAILSIAYNVPLAVLDGNVARVLARLLAVRGDLRVPRLWRQLGGAAQDLLSREFPGDWNQALMELGETVCTPHSPRCTECPVSKWCRARARGLTDSIPAPRRKRATVRVRVAAAILLDPQDRTLLVREPGLHDSALFSRMWQFPAVEVKRNPTTELARHVNTTLGLGGQALDFEQMPAARHGVTFRNITLMPFLARIAELSPRVGARVVPLTSVGEMPVSSATRKLAGAALPSSRGH